MCKPIITSAAASIILISSANASDRAGHFMQYGGGAQTCAEVLADIARDGTETTWNYYFAWIGGMLTGMSLQSKTVAITHKPNSDIYWMTLAMCKHEPESKFAEMAAYVIEKGSK